MSVLHRFRFVLLGVTSVALIAATFMSLRNDDGGSYGPRGHLGPTPGPGSAETYIKEKQRYLAALASERPQTLAAALISFKTFVPAPSVQRLVAGMKPTAVWVRFPSSQPEPVLVKTTVAGAVADRAADLRKVIDAEVAELEGQAAAAEGNNKTELEALLAQSKANLAKIKGDCGCVFAMTVEDATFDELKALQAAPSVRVVDVPKPPTNDLTGWDLQPFEPREK